MALHYCASFFTSYVLRELKDGVTNCHQCFKRMQIQL